MTGKNIQIFWRVSRKSEILTIKSNIQGAVLNYHFAQKRHLTCLLIVKKLNSLKPHREFLLLLSLSRPYACDVTTQLLFFGARDFSARFFKTFEKSFMFSEQTFLLLTFCYSVDFFVFLVDFCDVYRSKSNDNQNCITAELWKKTKEKTKHGK